MKEKLKSLADKVKEGINKASLYIGIGSIVAVMGFGVYASLHVKEVRARLHAFYEQKIEEAKPFYETRNRTNKLFEKALQKNDYAAMDLILDSVINDWPSALEKAKIHYYGFLPPQAEDLGLYNLVKLYEANKWENVYPTPFLK